MLYLIILMIIIQVTDSKMSEIISAKCFHKEVEEELQSLEEEVLSLIILEGTI